MRTRGKFIRKERWYSLCSMHQEYNEDCDMCKSGTWNNVVTLWFDGLLHDLAYPLWYHRKNGEYPPKNFKKNLKNE